MSNSTETLYCVKCGKASLTKNDEKSYRCNHCEFTYFHNVAAASGAFIKFNNKILLLERALDPAKGKLDIPGGFVDYGESNEQALSRELYEELQIVVKESQMSYLYSFPNQYLYKDVVYNTLDCFFEVCLDTAPKLILQQSEVSNYCWVDPKTLNLEDLAFNSCKQALTNYNKR
ncbi:NUDIX hydrolase [Paraglaciecola sp. 2405UD69-4]|uniref:NUDIX hydrolase n=1 Tax=Paraglaciecola sp. 2405UD69-4 TaxID=3391836 RepID=UPI0039C9EB8A